MERSRSLSIARSCAMSLVGASLVAACATAQKPRAGEPGVRVMEVTAYCPCRECCGWRRTCLGTPVYASGPRRGERKNIGVTATGTTARRGTIAADPTRYPYGTIMYIEGYGRGVVEDCGGAIKGEHIDIFFETHSEALQWGRKRMPVRILHLPGRRSEASPDNTPWMDGHFPTSDIPGLDALADLLGQGHAVGPLASTVDPAPEQAGTEVLTIVQTSDGWTPTFRLRKDATADKPGGVWPRSERAAHLRARPVYFKNVSI